MNESFSAKGDGKQLSNFLKERFYVIATRNNGGIFERLLVEADGYITHPVDKLIASAAELFPHCLEHFVFVG
jgi:hypothetical protein